MVSYFNFSSYTRFFVKFWVEKNVNELHFSDVYWSINYIGSLAKFSLYLNKLQKNGIHSLNKYQKINNILKNINI